MKTHLIHPVSALATATVILGACLLSGMQSPAGMNDEKQDILRHMTIVWLDDGQGKPVFMPGDSIEKITGRGVSLSAALNNSKVYPEIIQVLYLPEVQKTKLITRDLRFTEVVL